MDTEVMKAESSATPLILNRNPVEVLEDAKKAAQALTTVISQKKKPVIMNGEQYLEFEDWQTVGQFYGYMVSTGEAMLVEIDGVKGAKATAKLVNFHSGEILGGAESYCMRDEPNWKVKPWFQLASMAQTRAGAKALRNRLAWVVVLAGYRPTPAEEIQDMAEQKPAKPVATPAEAPRCPVHGVNFQLFTKGDSRWWSHRQENGWCNMSDVMKEVKDAPTAPDKPQEDEPAAQIEQVVTSSAPAATTPTEAAQGEPAKPKRDPATIKTLGDLFTACLKDFGMAKAATLKELGVTSQSDLTETPAECYIRVVAVRG